MLGGNPGPRGRAMLTGWNFSGSAALWSESSSGRPPASWLPYGGHRTARGSAQRSPSPPRSVSFSDSPREPAASDGWGRCSTLSGEWLARAGRDESSPGARGDRERRIGTLTVTLGNLTDGVMESRLHRLLLE